MEEQNSYIFDVKINVDAALKDATELKKSLDELKDTQKTLQSEYKKISQERAEILDTQSNEYKKLTEQLDANLAAQIQTNNIIKVQSKEYQDFNKVLQTKISLNNSESISIDTLRKNNSLLRKERDNLSITDEKDIKRRDELNVLIDKNTQLIKDNTDSATKQTLNIGNYEGAANNLAKELKEMTKQLIFMKVSGQENSKQYKDMAQRAGELKDQIGAAREEIKYFSSDSAVLDTVKNSFQILSDSTEVFTGILRATGIQSEELEQQLQQLRGVQEILNGLIGLQNALQKDSVLIKGLEVIKTKILTASQAAYNLVVGASTGALKLFKLALAGTGIGAFVVGLGTLIANWNQVSSAIRSNTEDWKNFKVALTVVSVPLRLIIELVELIIRNFDKISEVVSDTFAGITTGINNFASALLNFATGDFQKAMDKIYSISADTQEKINKNRLDSQKETNAKLLENSIFSQEQSLKLLKAQGKETIDQEINLANQRLKLLEAQNEAKNELGKEDIEALRDAEAQIIELETTKQQKINDLNQKASDERKKEKEKQLEENQKNIEKELEQKKQLAENSIRLLEIEFETWKVLNKSKLTESDKLNNEALGKEEQRLRTQAELELNILNEKLANNSITEQEYNLERLQINTELNEAISKQDAEYDISRKEQQIQRDAIDFENKKITLENNLFATIELERQSLNQKYLQEKEFAEKIGADVSLINEKYRQADLELTKATTDAKLSLAADFAGNIAQIFGQQTAVGKAAAIAETTINTYKSATAAYSALAGIPIVGPVLGAAAAGAAIAAGLANVKKIIAVKSGLAGEKSVSGSIPSSQTSTSSATPTQLNNVNAEIGQGIVSRNSNIQSSNKIILQPVLPVEQVTIAQNKQLKNNEVAVL